MKDYIKVFAVFALLLLAIPAVAFYGEKAASKDGESSSQMSFSETDTVTILNNSTGELSKSSLRDYLIGCILAQLPPDAPPEAAKAQAVLCRTYIFSRRQSELSSPDPSLKGADVSDDSSRYFAFFTQEQAREFYGDEHQQAYDNAAAAVDSTAGLYIDYQGAPVIPAYHQLNCGRTESSQALWGVELPYLVSVESPYDTESEDYEKVAAFTPQELAARLNASFGADFGEQLPDENCFSLTATESTASVLTVSFTAGGEEYRLTGEQFASCLGLSSCCFEISFSDGEFSIRTVGSGHMVGLSLYGARRMAENGFDSNEILTHYFPETSIKSLETAGTH